jgi:hypothetical protein
VSRPCGALERALGEVRQARGHAAAVVDDGGDAGVGGTQHVPPGFQRPRTRDAQVLRRCERVSEPRDVRHVDEQRRLGELADDLLAERILVADVRRHALARDGERPGAGRAAGEIRHRDLQHVHDPAKARRHELAERNQVRLRIALRR